MLHLKISSTAYVFLCFTVRVVTLIATSTTKAAATNVSYVTNFCSDDTSTFSPNSTYQTNLNELLSWLSSNSTTRKNGYYNTTVVDGVNNTVYGAFLCRGDLTINACKDCVSTASTRVLQKCPVGKESVIWFAECMLRYSDHSFFSIFVEDPMMPLWSTGYTGSVSEQSSFMQVLGYTMKAVAEQAANGGDDKKFATKEANFSSFQKLYTLGQCTPDLSEFDCQRCLKEAVANLPSCCYGRQGGRVLFTRTFPLLPKPKGDGAHPSRADHKGKMYCTMLSVYCFLKELAASRTFFLSHFLNRFKGFQNLGMCSDYKFQFLPILYKEEQALCPLTLLLFDSVTLCI